MPCREGIRGPAFRGAGGRGARDATTPERLRDLPREVLERSGVITAPVGGLRMSPHIYNTAEHVERVAAALGALRHRLGHGQA